MLTLLEATRSNQLLELVNALDPSHEVVSIYGMNGRHFAWVRKANVEIKIEASDVKNAMKALEKKKKGS